MTSRELGGIFVFIARSKCTACTLRKKGVNPRSCSRLPKLWLQDQLFIKTLFWQWLVGLNSPVFQPNLLPICVHSLLRMFRCVVPCVSGTVEVCGLQDAWIQPVEVQCSSGEEANHGFSVNLNSQDYLVSGTSPSNCHGCVYVYIFQGWKCM